MSKSELLLRLEVLELYAETGDESLLMELDSVSSIPSVIIDDEFDVFLP